VLGADLSSAVQGRISAIWHRRAMATTSAAGRLRDVTARALDLALPATCLGCQAEGPPLCDRCATRLDVRLDSPAGVPIGLPGDLPVPLLQLDWCAPFHGLAREALHAIKYRAETRLADPLGAAIAHRWRRVGVGATVIVHVPVHDARARRRGYDQAALIARAAAQHLGLPHVDALVRTRATTAQFDLDRRHRAANVAGAFATRPERAHLIRDRWILLIDDVVTTGASLAACGRALEAAGALGVSAITVARER
jgi:ComF family protein